MHNFEPDGIITFDEFMEYYNNVSSSIDNDNYFELMMNNAWKLGDQPSENRHAWSGEVGSRGASAGKVFAGTCDPKYGVRGANERKDQQQTFGITGQTYNQNPKEKSPLKNLPNSSNNPLLEKFRQKLAGRGARGIIGLQRQFKIMDDNHSNTIDQSEFTKGCHDFRIDITDHEIRKLFQIFDVDNNGVISFDELLRGVKGPMNMRRQNFVRRAFQKFDKDHSGQIDINDLRGVYSAKKHPDVIAGKKTEDEILGEFLETFEMHHAMKMKHETDQIITYEEFMEYYSNVSCSIDDDA